jgi:hypothetical protein
MSAFLSANAGTILIGVILLAVVAAIAAKLVRDRKKGKCAGCGCGCGSADCRKE